MVSIVDNSSLADPHKQIITHLETNPEDAQALAMHVDVSAIVKAFKEINYDLQRKIRELGTILDTGTNPQKMAAMDRLDDIREAAVSKRGILQLPSGSASGVDQPLSQPHAKTVEFIEKSIKMTMESTAGLKETIEEKQPLKEHKHDDESEATQAEQDAFFADTRGEKDVFRAPSVRIGDDDED